MDDYINKIFNEWKILEKDEFNTKKYKKSYYWCQCSCGSNPKSVRIADLKNGKNTNCGCKRVELYKRLRDINKKYNTYDLTGEYGIGWTFKNQEFYFDLKYYNLIKDYCWYFTKENYVASGKNRKTLMMHRLISNPNDGMVVDHINHIKWDNREENLRICTNQENTFNNTSKGYSYNKNTNKWNARIRAYGEEINIGKFDTEEEAKEARRKAEIEYFGEFAIIDDLK